MAAPFLMAALISGEVSPQLYGRIDIDRERIAATTCRNMQVDYRAGVSSRAGTSFVGFSKQTEGRSFPPRVIPFQFSINQGLVLEFGNEYMRIIFQGAYVTEGPVAISGATQASPGVLSFGAEGATAATPNNGAVTFSYAPSDLITLAGGTVLSPAVLSVTTSELVSILPNVPGTGYGIGDTVTLGGGTPTSQAIATVQSLQSVKAAGDILFATNPANNDTITLNSVTWTFKTTGAVGNQTNIQGTLSATLAQLAIDLNASTNASLTVATYSSTGTELVISYDTAGTGGNAYTLAASAGTPSGATLSGGSATGIGSLSVSTAGVYTSLPVNGQMTETATSGGGSGASFQTAVFGPHAVTISNPGAYSAVPSNPVAQASSTGVGEGATFNVTWGAVAAFNNGDAIFVTGVDGMVELNGNTYVVAGATSSSVELFDIYGNPVDTSGFGAYTGSGTASRIYTVPTIYGEQDLPWLKFTQSADVMTICCVNQLTGTEYPPQDLARLSDTDWTFTNTVVPTGQQPPFGTSIQFSKNTGGNPFQPGQNNYGYAYAVTAISPDDGSESIASNVATGFCIALDGETSQATIVWDAVSGVDQYNIYKATPVFSATGAQIVPVGALLGYVGTAYGASWTDTNIAPDFSQVPPKHQAPFARGQILGVSPITQGAGYTTATGTINTSTGSGAVIEMVVINQGVIGVVIDNPGHDYGPNDTITITGDGTGATAKLLIGAQMGTYPSVPSYFQERRAYANTLNNTDTYFMSQPGSFLNFDTRIPTIDTDAITGSPWSVQVNGIQQMLQIPPGLLVMTGSSAWILAGAGSFATNVQPISPANQNNVPQAFIGISPLVEPVKIHYDVIFLSAKGSYYYDLPYQLYALSEPLDITELSSHLFDDHTITDNAWCEQPNKILWAVRDDGVLLSLTYYKAQQVAGWARHDTAGLVKSVCSITEPPVDALYMVTERFINGHTAYMIERMDNRLWTGVETCWCVDCGLSLAQPKPNATLTADDPSGVGTITGVAGLVGGQNYSSATAVSISDPTGTGATATPTIVAGAITGITITAGGTAYTNPQLEISDPAGSAGGSGASASAVLSTIATFTASAAVFGSGDVGSVVRMGGGIATITAFVNSGEVQAEVTQPITDLIVEGSTRIVKPQAAGTWSMTKPITNVLGLDHLIGATVTGLADGNVITPRVVNANGEVTLDAPASAVVIGLPFQAQVQTVYFEAGGPTTSQGQRKKISNANVLITASRGALVGGSQPDGSTFSPIQIAPQWSNLTPLEYQPSIPQPAYNSKVEQLHTGYLRLPLSSDWDTTGQISLQQDLPLPLNLGAVVFEVLAGDTPSVAFQQQGGGGNDSAGS